MIGTCDPAVTFCGERPIWAGEEWPADEEEICESVETFGPCFGLGADWKDPLMMYLKILENWSDLFATSWFPFGLRQHGALRDRATSRLPAREELRSYGALEAPL